MMWTVLFAVVLPASLSSATTRSCEQSTEKDCVDSGDSSVLLQLPRQASLADALSHHADCRSVLPLLEKQGADLFDLCQQALPATTCKDSLAALGPGPWTDDVVSKVCEVWSEGAANSARASLLSRSSTEASKTSLKELDASLFWKGGDNDYGNGGAGETNTTNATVPPGTTADCVICFTGPCGPCQQCLTDKEGDCDLCWTEGGHEACLKEDGQAFCHKCFTASNTTNATGNATNGSANATTNASADTTAAPADTTAAATTAPATDATTAAATTAAP